MRMVRHAYGTQAQQRPDLQPVRRRGERQRHLHDGCILFGRTYGYGALAGRSRGGGKHGERALDDGALGGRAHGDCTGCEHALPDYAYDGHACVRFFVPRVLPVKTTAATSCRWPVMERPPVHLRWRRRTPASICRAEPAPMPSHAAPLPLPLPATRS
jgi:hypothetical protein